MIKMSELNFSINTDSWTARGPFLDSVNPTKRTITNKQLINNSRFL